MTDSSAWLICEELSRASRDRLMRRWFGFSGIHLNFLRLPMGASDFAAHGRPYSCDDRSRGHPEPVALLDRSRSGVHRGWMTSRLSTLMEAGSSSLTTPRQPRSVSGWPGTVARSRTCSRPRQWSRHLEPFTPPETLTELTFESRRSWHSCMRASRPAGCRPAERLPMCPIARDA